MDCSELCSLRSKLDCIFERQVWLAGAGATNLKRPSQDYYVKATDTLCESFKHTLKEFKCMPTEKVDGTSTIVKKYNDQVCLWARRDRKLTKVAKEKNKQKNEIKFNMEDFNEVPESWTPCETCVDSATGALVPDNNGTIMGWIPLNSDKLYMWHAETVDTADNRILVLNSHQEGKTLKFELTLDLLEDHENESFELIGTNVQGNPYKLGSKRSPLHFLLRHGCISVTGVPDDLTCNSMTEWFNGVGKMEGLVWHCSNGEMHKLTRYHLNLKWPIDDPIFCERRLFVNLDTRATNNKYINNLMQMNGQSFESMTEFSNFYIAHFTK